MTRCLRQLVVSVLIFLLATLVTEAVHAQPLGLGSSKGEEPPQYGVLSSQNGRFAFGQISSSSKDLFMLDTATGRLWRMGESGKIGIFLKAVPYLDPKGDCTFLPDKTPDPKAKTTEKK